MMLRFRNKLYNRYRKLRFDRKINYIFYNNNFVCRFISIKTRRKFFIYYKDIKLQNRRKRLYRFAKNEK